MKKKLLVLAFLLFALTGSANITSAAPPTITISDSVGTNPTTVYTTGSTTRVVTAAWNAGTEYRFCEVYYTVNNANQAELGRGHDGSTPITLTAGNSYEFWMIIYTGDNKFSIVSRLDVIAKLGNAAPSTPPAGGGGGISSTGGFDEKAKRESGELKQILNAPFISDVSVRPDSRNVVISFASTQSTPPLVEIGKVPPVPDRFGVIAFPFNSGAFSRFVPGQNGRYVLDVDVLGEQLEIGTTYYYIINVFNNNRNDTTRLREQITGQFKTLSQTVKIFWERIKIEDDSDDLSTAEGYFWFTANFGQPNSIHRDFNNNDMDTGHNYYVNGTDVITNAPDKLILTASGLDLDTNDLYIRDSDSPPISGPGDAESKYGDVNGASQEFDLSKLPENKIVDFSLATSGGSLRFVVFGHFEIIRGENVGTASSGLQTGTVIRPQRRIHSNEPGRTTPLTICEAAREARERNNPAAAGLEAQCRAQGGLRPRGRVESPAGELKEAIPICESARIARERNSPAGPGLEQKCLASKGLAIANQDAVLSAGRNADPDELYRLGFDVATGIFGDPALGALGNTATGPGSMRIRNSLSPAAQRGFDAALKIHLSRNYRH